MSEPVPVIFRADGAEVVAVFPTIAADVCGVNVQCFAHVGQHAGCSPDWYRTTRPATPEQAAELKAELRRRPIATNSAFSNASRRGIAPRASREPDNANHARLYRKARDLYFVRAGA